MCKSFFDSDLGVLHDITIFVMLAKSVPLFIWAFVMLMNAVKKKKRVQSGVNQ